MILAGGRGCQFEIVDWMGKPGFPIPCPVEGRGPGGSCGSSAWGRGGQRPQEGELDHLEPGHG